MNILGLNAFHADSAACIIKDGVLIAAAEEERFRRVKHWAGFPSEAIRWCLDEAGFELQDLHHVALNQDTKANLLPRAKYLLSGGASLGLIRDRLKNRGARAGAAELLERLFPGQRFRGVVHAVEHHQAHLAAAFLVSPFSEAGIVSVDGFGDFASTVWGSGRGNEIAIDGRVYFPHSLGIFYEAITQYLGFPHYGDEYKVMGLAPYGQPNRMAEMRQIVRLGSDGHFELDLRFFRHHRERATYQWEDGVPNSSDLFTQELEMLLGPRRGRGEDLAQKHWDIARSAQAMYEEAFFGLLDHIASSSGLEAIALAGGCANNSVANGKIRRRTKFQHVYVHAAPGDAGGAIGAALEVWRRSGGDRSFRMEHAYWGPSFAPDEVNQLLVSRQKELAQAGCVVELISDEDELCARTAREVSDGKVIGWFQGRMEWGPRALGNRSIVCDPRRADMKQILNAKIKRREGFRPFAPSILQDAVSAWFEEEDEVPFMMQVFQIRDDKRHEIPAVTHVDGSGRLQTVTFDTNKRYAKLIRAFDQITGVPMVLNTSFNENEPVVCRPTEALDCFLRTQMDVLVLGDHLITRSAATSS